MMISRKLLFSFLALNLVSAHVALPMGASRATQFARAAFSRGCTAAHWGIAVGPFWWQAYNDKDKMLISDEEKKAVEKVTSSWILPILDLDPFYNAKAKKAQEAVKTELEKCTKKKWDSVKIIPLPKIAKPEPAAGSAYHYNTHSDQLEKIDLIAIPAPSQVIQSKGFIIDTLNWFGWRNDTYELNPAIKPVIQHEIAHLEHNDSLKRYLALLVAPLLTHGIVKSGKIAYRIVKPITQNPSLVKDIAKIPTGVLKSLFSGGSYIAYKKYQEQQADNAIENTVENLEALKHYFAPDQTALKKIQLLIRHAPKQEQLIILNLLLKEVTNPTLLPLILPQKSYIIPLLIQLNNSYPRLFEEIVFLEHPSFSSRIEKLDKRIATLKKQQEREINTEK